MTDGNFKIESGEDLSITLKKRWYLVVKRKNKDDQVGESVAFQYIVIRHVVEGSLKGHDDNAHRWPSNFVNVMETRMLFAASKIVWS